MIKKFKNSISNFSLHDYKVVQFASFSAFVISATFTIMLMTSQCLGWISITLTFCMGILLEFGKSYFFTRAIDGKGYTKAIRGIFLIVSTFLFLYSILASLSFLANESNKIIEPGKVANSETAKKLDEVKTKETLLGDKKTALTDYKKATENSITDVKNSTNNLPKDYIDYSTGMDFNDVARAETDKATKMTNDKNKEIDKRNLEIEKLTNEISTLKNSVRADTTDKSGYTAFVKQIVDKLNKGKKSNLWAVDEVMTLLLSGLSILFEIVAVLLYYSASAEKKNAEAPKDDNGAFETVKPIETYANCDENYAYAKRSEHLEVSNVYDDYKSNNMGFKHDSKVCYPCTFDTRKVDKDYKHCKNENKEGEIPINTEFYNLKNDETLIRTKHSDDYKRNNVGFKHDSKIDNPYTFDTRREATDCNIDKNDTNADLKHDSNVDDAQTFDTRKADGSLENNIVIKDIHFEITREKIEKYIDFVKSCISNDKICPSNASVAKNTNLKYSEIRTIKNILKANEIIDVDEQKKRTILIRVPDVDEINSWGWA